MKKFLVVMTALLSAGCASDDCPLKKTAVVETPVVEEKAPVEAPAPCGCQQAPVVAQPTCPNVAPQPCACSRPSPCREIQRPRIKETVAPKPRRQCPTDGQTIDCGCGSYKTFEQPTPAPQTYTYTYETRPAVIYTAPVVTQAPQEIVPAMPEAYVLASNRVVSRFFKDSSSVYAQKPNVKLYVRPGQVTASDLPAGIDSGVNNFKKQVSASYTFEIVDNPSDADYYVDTTASWFDTPSKTVPAILYTTTLTDRQNNKVREWVEIIKKADNTKSWL